MSSQAIVIVPAGRQWYNKPVSLLTFYVKGKLNQPTKWRVRKSGVSFLCYLSSCLCSIMKQGRQDCLCCLYVLSCSLVIILPWVILWWFQWKVFISILCICSVTIHYLLCARHCSRHCGYNKEQNGPNSCSHGVHTPLPIELKKKKNGASPVAQWVKNLLAMLETWVWSLGQEDSPGEGNGYPLL